MDALTAPSTPIKTKSSAEIPSAEETTDDTPQAMLVQLTTDGVPKLHCPVCNKALISLSGYVKHVKKHEPPGGFLCRYCEERFCSEEELKRHRDAQHTTLACRICKEVTFSNEEEYREHIRIVHNGIDRQLYTCDKCGAEYKTIDPFRRHLETQCGTIKPHKCDQCPMAFITKYNLKQHKENHKGERKFCCSYCGKNFLQKGRLVEHERSHTGEKPYKCDVCGKCFAHRESIVTHSSIHTGIRLVECKCCLSRFSCYSNLIKHRRTRPETCGLPEYDPPKNRVRTHRPRIPPTLNPTSEIKVSNLNKIIKPTDKSKERKSTKKEPNAKKYTTRKLPTSGTGRGPGRPRKKKLPSDSEEEEEEETVFSSESSESDEPLIKRQTRGSLAQQNGTATAAVTKTEVKALSSASDSEEDYPEFEIANSGNEVEQRDFKMPIKQEQPETVESVGPLQQQSNFEYTDASHYVDPTYGVKCEDDSNIFHEKDKLLSSLLNDANLSALEHIETETEMEQKLKTVRGRHIKCEKDETLPLQNSSKATDEADILQESEVILIKDEFAAIQPEEVDVLELKDLATESDLTDCKIMLEDVKLRYPKLKDDTTVKVGRNTSPFFGRRKVKKAETKRKYRKRDQQIEVNLKASKRMAKMSQQELKDRLKLMKKEGKSWSCPYCIKIYHMRKPYEKHLRLDHKRPEEEIRTACKTEDLGVVNEDIFKCHICEKIYLVEKRLLAHVQLHGPTGNLTFKCPCYCNLYFASRDEATAHAQAEHRDLLYCEYCEKFLTGHDSLKIHIKNHHSEKSPRDVKRNLVCDKCGKKFSGRTSLTDHVRSDCGRMPLYACHICGKHLTTAGILKTHLLLHKDDTPYQCDKCGKTFKVKAQYKTHLKTRHTDVKPFKCHLCPKEYPYRESLLTHMTVHTGIKRFLCNGCGKRFTCISNLQAHRKVHADTCGQLPLNAKATQYMGVQKGNLLLGAKPEAGLEYCETNTLIARDVLDRDLPMAQELNFPSEPSAPLATVPLNYSQQQPPTTVPVPAPVPIPAPVPLAIPPAAPNLVPLPHLLVSQLIEDSHSSSFNQ